VSKVLIAALITAVIALGVVVALYASASPLWYSSGPQRVLLQKLEEALKDYIIVHIGESNPLLDEVMKMCRNVTHVASFKDIESPLQLVQSNAQKKILVVFSGDYLDKAVSDQKFINSLRRLHNACGEERCTYLAIGGKTQRLLSALRYAGIHGHTSNNLTIEISTRLWDPLDWNPPVVGVRFNPWTDGVKKWLADSILICYNPATMESLTECIPEWLQYKAPCTPSVQIQSSQPQHLTTLAYLRVIDSYPHGRLNVIIDVYHSANDGNPDYDWYFYVVNIQSVPGKVAYGSDWETADHDAYHTLDSLDAGKTNWFVDYGPTTTFGYTSASSIATVSLGITVVYTYNIPWIAIRDRSDFSEYRIEWIHDFNEQNDDSLYGPSSNICTVKPGFVVEAKNVAICDSGLHYCWTSTYAHVVARYKIAFGHPMLWRWEYKTFTSPTIYLYVSNGRSYTW
jgi:hypothetical protein